MLTPDLLRMPIILRTAGIVAAEHTRISAQAPHLGAHLGVQAAASHNLDCTWVQTLLVCLTKALQ